MKNMMISADEKKLLRKVEIRSHTCFLAATMVNMEGNGFDILVNSGDRRNL